MTRYLTAPGLLIAGLCLSALLYGWLLLIREPEPEKPYLKILGSGFIFNYRVADVYAGFTAIPQKPFPVGTLLQVTFENPSGGSPFVLKRRLGLPERRLSIRSPSMRGVKAKVRYRINITLQSQPGVAPFWQKELFVSSQISDNIIPEKPLTIGPGYQQPFDPQQKVPPENN